MAIVNVFGHIFEAGTSILHPRNLHSLNYTKLLNLVVNSLSDNDESSSSTFGIWDSRKFVFTTLGFKSELPFVDKIVSLANSLLMLFRYDYSPIRMDKFVERGEREVDVGSVLKGARVEGMEGWRGWTDEKEEIGKGVRVGCGVTGKDFRV
ncbi:hypothetical protein ACFX2I_037856 [Malus domestica]